MNKFFIVLPCTDGYTYFTEENVPVLAQTKEDVILTFDQMLDAYVKSLNTWLEEETRLSTKMSKLNQNAKDFHDRYLEIHNERSKLSRPKFVISGVTVDDDGFVEVLQKGRGVSKIEDYHLQVVSLDEVFENAQTMNIS